MDNPPLPALPPFTKSLCVPVQGQLPRSPARAATRHRLSLSLQAGGEWLEIASAEGVGELGGSWPPTAPKTHCRG